jgi:hypothetical protein
VHLVFTGWRLDDRHSPTPVQGRTKHWSSRIGMQLWPLGHSLCPLWSRQGRGPHQTWRGENRSWQLSRNIHPQFQNIPEPQQLSHPTLEQAILPFRHWQALQSSSHLAPSGITLPMVMQGLPETERWRCVSRSFLFRTPDPGSYYSPSLLRSRYARAFGHVITVPPTTLARVLPIPADSSLAHMTCFG